VDGLVDGRVDAAGRDEEGTEALERRAGLVLGLVEAEGARLPVVGLE
jgi:hypothetical protein